MEIRTPNLKNRTFATGPPFSSQFYVFEPFVCTESICCNGLKYKLLAESTNLRRRLRLIDHPYLKIEARGPLFQIKVPTDNAISYEFFIQASNGFNSKTSDKIQVDVKALEDIIAGGGGLPSTASRFSEDLKPIRIDLGNTTLLKLGKLEYVLPAVIPTEKTDVVSLTIDGLEEHSFITFKPVKSAPGIPDVNTLVFDMPKITHIEEFELTLTLKD